MGAIVARYRRIILLVLSYALITGAALFVIYRPSGEPLRLVEPTGQVEISLAQSPTPVPADCRCADTSPANELQETGTKDALSSPEVHGGTGNQPAKTQLSSKSSTGKININQAQTQELEQLPGIGPALAKRIVAYRHDHGPFRTADDIVQVKGIGPVLLSRLHELITVR